MSGIAFMKVGPYWPNTPKVKGFTLFSRGEASEVNFRGDSPLAEACRRDVERLVGARTPFHWISQVHGNRAILLPQESDIEVDGVVTRTPLTACIMRSADCLPVFFAARDGTAVGIAHAGWRGLRAGILQSTFRRLERDTRDVLCWMAPAISARFYEVDNVVFDEFIGTPHHTEGVFEPKGDGKYHMDMYRMAHNILIDIGVLPSHISGGEFCTYSDRRMHSVRRDGKSAGRMASLIWIAE